MSGFLTSLKAIYEKHHDDESAEERGRARRALVAERVLPSLYRSLIQNSHPGTFTVTFESPEDVLSALYGGGPARFQVASFREGVEAIPGLNYTFSRALLVHVKNDEPGTKPLALRVPISDMELIRAAVEWENGNLPECPSQSFLSDVLRSENGRCANCRVRGDLKTCSQCLKVKYCGVECQKAHRRKHKPDCALTKAWYDRFPRKADSGTAGATSDNGGDAS